LAKIRRILLCPDVHAPYQHREAYACFLAVAEGWRPHTCIVLGDFADCYQVSSFGLDPRRVIKSFADEMAGVVAARKELDAALKAGGCKDKRFLQGNHEVRIERYMLKNAEKMLEFSKPWDEIMELHKARWEVHAYKTSIQLGKLRVTHDIERAGVYAARQSQLDMGCSVAFGHTPRLQVHYQGTIDGPRHVGATCGWLGDPEFIDYKHRDKTRRDSIHGFATVNMLDSGEFWLQAVPIVDGRCIVDGQLYQAPKGNT
jgi:hypothetical protein